MAVTERVYGQFFDWKLSIPKAFNNNLDWQEKKWSSNFEKRLFQPEAEYNRLKKEYKKISSSFSPVPCVKINKNKSEWYKEVQPHSLSLLSLKEYQLWGLSPREVSALKEWKLMNHKFFMGWDYVQFYLCMYIKKKGFNPYVEGAGRRVNSSVRLYFRNNNTQPNT